MKTGGGGGGGGGGGAAKQSLCSRFVPSSKPVQPKHLSDCGTTAPARSVQSLCEPHSIHKHHTPLPPTHYFLVPLVPLYSGTNLKLVLVPLFSGTEFVPGISTTI